MMRRSRYYALDADRFAANEALPYFDIENMVYYLYEAGQIPVNNYVYNAFLLVEHVLNRDKDEWENAFRKWRSDMRSGTRTIECIGISLWSSIFRAFYFASPKWTDTEKSENYKNLIYLYRIHLNERPLFSQSVIEDLTPLWEGISDIDSYVVALDLVSNMEIKNNWNNYDLFYQFLGKSLQVAFELGYIVRTDFWKIKDLLKDSDNLEEMKEISENIVKEIGKEVNHSIQVLRQKANIRMEDVPHYEMIRCYLEFVNRVMTCEDTEKVNEEMRFSSKIYDQIAENSRKLKNIERNDEFVDAINRNEDNLPVGNLIHIVESREDN